MTGLNNGRTKAQRHKNTQGTAVQTVPWVNFYSFHLSVSYPKILVRTPAVMIETVSNIRAPPPCLFWLYWLCFS